MLLGGAQPLTRLSQLISYKKNLLMLHFVAALPQFVMAPPQFVVALPQFVVTLPQFVVTKGYSI